MRIAIIYPVADRPPTRAYAVWARSARAFSDVVHRSGVEVCPVPIRDSGRNTPSFRSGVVGAEPALQLTRLFGRASDFDLIHNLIGFGPLPYAGFVDTPLLSTVWRDTWRHAPDVFEEMNQRAYYVAPTELDRMQGLRYSATLPWGLDVQNIPFRANPDTHFAFLGALLPNAGVEQALELGRKANRTIVLVGGVENREYFDSCVAPFLGENVLHRHNPASLLSDSFVGRAAGIVHLGSAVGMQKLALLDAACRGTPIMAIDDDGTSCPKVGITGYRYASVDAAIAGIEQLVALNREACRKYVVDECAHQQLVPSALDLYEEIVGRTSREDRRPWGYYKVLADELDHKVKRLVVHPGQRLSLQRHRRRSEHWYVIAGEAMVVAGGEEQLLTSGQSIEIPTRCWHRIRNHGTQNLTIIEVQTGEYFGEDDIERREDDYGRVPSQPL